MSNDPLSPTNGKNKSSSIAMGAAGAGGGTLLVLLANNLPDASLFKSWLVIIAPSASVFLGSLLFWLKNKVSSYFENKMVQNELEKIREMLKTALNDDNTSEQHKEEMRKKLESLDKIAVNIRLNKIKVVVQSARTSARKTE
ncbi:MAG: hypothetical protein QX189_10935 [Methylococcales bacterium]